jgi:hypothetical protein
MKLIPGYKIRNITFLEYGVDRLVGKWKCPFCKRPFEMSVADVRLKYDILSCGCVDYEEAKIRYCERVVKALSSEIFTIAAVCRKAGITVAMYKSFMNDDNFCAEVEEAMEIKKDMIERAFLNGINDGNPHLIIAALKSKLMADRDISPPQAFHGGHLVSGNYPKIIDNIGDEYL